MLVWKRAAAVPVVVGLAVLSGAVIAPAADAFCGSLCSEGGLEAVAALDAMDAPVAAGAAPVAASVQAASGISGIGLNPSGVAAIGGTLGAAVGGPLAYLGIKGFVAGVLNVGPTVTGVATGAGSPIGWSASPTLTGLWGDVWTAGVTEPATSPYGKSSGTLTMQLTQSAGTASSWSGSKSVGYEATMAPECRSGSTVDTAASRAHSNGGAGQSSGGSFTSNAGMYGPRSLGGTVTWSCTSGWTFDHIDLVLHDYGPTGDVKVTAAWYPAGYPSRPAGTVGGAGVIGRHITCKSGTGTSTISDTIPANLAGPGSVAAPALTCPAGSVAASASMDFTPTGGATQTLAPPVSTRPWVQDLPAEYPSCIDAPCTLELYRTAPAPTTSCGDLAVACPKWYTDPARAESYECRYGGIVTDLDRCSVYRVVGQVLPNTSLDPATGAMTYVEWPPLPDPSPDPLDAPGTDSSDCWPNGWSGFNPAEWVLMPVKCALTWAFVPETTPQKVQQLVDTMSTRTPVPQLESLFGVLAPPTSSASACLDFAIPVWFIDRSIPVIDTCNPDDPIVRALAPIRVLLAVCVWVGFAAPLAWWAWKQYSPGSQGVA